MLVDLRRQLRHGFGQDRVRLDHLLEQCRIRESVHCNLAAHRVGTLRRDQQNRALESCDHGEEQVEQNEGVRIEAVALVVYGPERHQSQEEVDERP